MEIFKAFFNEYMRLNPRAPDDMIIYQLNTVQLKVSDFKTLFDNSIVAEYCIDTIKKAVDESIAGHSSETLDEINNAIDTYKAGPL